MEKKLVYTGKTKDVFALENGNYLLKFKDIKGYCSADMLFSGILPKTIGIEICKALSLYKQNKKISQFNRRELVALAQKAKNYELEITGTKGFANAQVTSCGISVKESSRKRWNRSFAKACSLSVK